MSVGAYILCWVGGLVITIVVAFMVVKFYSLIDYFEDEKDDDDCQSKE
jgi:hypothetical protein